MSEGHIHDHLAAGGASAYEALRTNALMIHQALVEVLQEHHGGRVELDEGLLDRALGDDEFTMHVHVAPGDPVVLEVVPTPAEYRAGTGGTAISGAVCCGDLFDRAAGDDAPMRRWRVQRVDELDRAHLVAASGLTVTVPTTVLLAGDDGWQRASIEERP